MSKNPCFAMPTDRPSSIQYASPNARVRTYSDQPTIAAPRIAAAIAAGRAESLGRSKVTLASRAAGARCVLIDGQASAA